MHILAIYQNTALCKTFWLVYMVDASVLKSHIEWDILNTCPYVKSIWVTDYNQYQA